MQVHKNHIPELLKDDLSRSLKLGTHILDFCLQTSICTGLNFTDMQVYVLIRTYKHDILGTEYWKDTVEGLYFPCFI